MAVYTHCCRAQPLRQLGFLVYCLHNSEMSMTSVAGSCRGLFLKLILIHKAYLISSFSWLTLLHHIFLFKFTEKYWTLSYINVSVSLMHINDDILEIHFLSGHSVHSVHASARSKPRPTHQQVQRCEKRKYLDSNLNILQLLQLRIFKTPVINIDAEWP